MSETMEMITGGAVFGALGVASLWLIGFTRGRVSMILGFIVMTLIISLVFGVKYIFLNGLFFGLFSMFYSGAVLMYRVTQCSKELKEAISRREKRRLHEEAGRIHR